MANIIKLLHYKNPTAEGCDYATVSEREYPKSNLYKFYSKDKLPKKYQTVIKNPCDEDSNGIEKWYLGKTVKKSYKEYPYVIIGTSNIAALTLTGMKGKTVLSSEILKFGGDGCYNAYFVDEDAEIGEHYQLAAEFTDWVRIYDDFTCEGTVWAEKIKIYRAGDYGCIIQTFGKTKSNF